MSLSHVAIYLVILLIILAPVVALGRLARWLWKRKHKQVPDKGD